ncbi:MAG: hypothetical protein ACOC04_05615, partial [Halothece sp.]
MQEAKSYRLAGESVYANDSGVDYDFCKKYLVYCPHCKQWLHYKEYQEDIRQPHFAHYDLPDKDCNHRNKSRGGTTRGNSVSRDQRLTDIQQQFENFFIDHSIYQNKVLEECSSIVYKYVEWFLLGESQEYIVKSYENENDKAFCYLTISLLSLDSNQSVLKKIVAYAIQKSFDKSRDTEIKQNIRDIVIEGLKKSIKEYEKIDKSDPFQDKFKKIREEFNELKGERVYKLLPEGWYVLHVQKGKELEIANSIITWKESDSFPDKEKLLYHKWISEDFTLTRIKKLAHPFDKNRTPYEG